MSLRRVGSTSLGFLRGYYTPTAFLSPPPGRKRRTMTAAGAAALVPKVDLHLGTMTFGWSQSSKKVDDTAAQQFLGQFVGAGHRTVDAARIYAGGKSEQMLGRVMAKGHGGPTGRSCLTVVTKAHPSQPQGLSAEGLRAQVAASLEALGVDSVELLYLHQPDTKASLVESLQTVHALIEEGKVGAYGLSNYAAVEVARCVAICEEKQLTKPVVYQGLYNAINRRVDTELFPTLRAAGMAFVAYNPLAAGLLTGKHSPGGEVQAGRFKNNPNYLDRFYKPDLFEGLQLVRDACEEAGVSMTGAAFRWLLCHSALQDGGPHAPPPPRPHRRVLHARALALAGVGGRWTWGCSVFTPLLSAGVHWARCMASSMQCHQYRCRYRRNVGESQPIQSFLIAIVRPAAQVMGSCWGHPPWSSSQRTSSSVVAVAKAVRSVHRAACRRQAHSIACTLFD
jgi:aflatoxin B1 aldehyde reductase